MLIDIIQSERADYMAEEVPATVPASVTERKIGNTTYIVTSRFNGDKGRDIVSALVRMVGRDINLAHKERLKKVI